MQSRYGKTVTVLVLALLFLSLWPAGTVLVGAAPPTPTGLSTLQTPTTVITPVATATEVAQTLTPTPSSSPAETSGGSGFELSWPEYWWIAGLILGLIFGRWLLGLVSQWITKSLHVGRLSCLRRPGKERLPGPLEWVYTRGMGFSYLVIMLTAFLGSVAYAKWRVGSDAVPAVVAAFLVIMLFSAVQVPAWLRPDFFLYYLESTDGETFPHCGKRTLSLPQAKRCLVAFCLVNTGGAVYRNALCRIQLHPGLEVHKDGSQYQRVEHHRAFELELGPNCACFKDVVIPPRHVAILPLLITPHAETGALAGNFVELVTESRWGEFTEPFTVTITQA